MQPAFMIPSLELSALRPGTLSGLVSTGLESTFQNNIWWSLINKTFKQLNAERAHRRARQDAAQYGLKLRLKKNKKYISLQAPKRVGPPLMSQGTSKS